jgi:hypothetical protein
MTSHPLVAAALLLTCALPVSAQTTYAPPGDTLRFRETTLAKMTLTSPQGEIPVTIEHRALVAVTRTRADSARAWYDSLSLMASTPAGEQRPATDSALKQPFVLGFDARGHVKLVKAPTFPKSFESLTDLSHEFDDFFLRLPAKPLAVGLAWADSSSRTDSTAEKFVKWASNADYRVERDTVVAGTPAVVVSMKQRIRINGEGPVPNQPLRATTTTEGTEEGFFVFAPKAGRVIGRRRSGKMEGDIFMKGAMGEMTMKQAYSYTGTLDAVR